VNHGDPVEVNIVWASNGALREPSRTWSKDYTFESQEGDVVKVRIASGVFAGCVVNYPAKDVRPREVAS
jgi:hypothetical protein